MQRVLSKTTQAELKKLLEAHGNAELVLAVSSLVAADVELSVRKAMLDELRHSWSDALRTTLMLLPK